MAELPRNLMRHLVLAEGPDVNGAAGALIPHGEIFPGDRGANGGRVGIEMFANEIKVAERGGHQNIGATATLDEIAHDVLSVADQVLRRCGRVIDVEGG